MSEYTPTTDAVRDGYVEGVEHDCYYEGDVKATPDGLYEREAFNRWLAEVERAAAEKAWDEGNTNGYNDARDYHLYDGGCGPDTWDCGCDNPYRRNEGENE